MSYKKEFEKSVSKRIQDLVFFTDKVIDKADDLSKKRDKYLSNDASTKKYFTIMTALASSIYEKALITKELMEVSKSVFDLDFESMIPDNMKKIIKSHDQIVDIEKGNVLVGFLSPEDILTSLKTYEEIIESGKLENED